MLRHWKTTLGGVLALAAALYAPLTGGRWPIQTELAAIAAGAGLVAAKDHDRS